MDMLMYYAVMAVLLCSGMAWVTGRMMDIHWRTKQLRTILKKDFGLLYLINKDNKTHKITMVDFGADEIKVGSELWIIDNRHIYRSDKREKGFFLDDSNIKFEEGVPVAYVDHDHLEPVVFYKPEGTTKPMEISAWLTSFVANQLAKKIKQEGPMKTLLIIVIGLVLVNILLGWFNHQDIVAVKSVVAAAASPTPSPGLIISGPTPMP